MTAPQLKPAFTESERIKLEDEAITRLFRDKTPPNGRVSPLNRNGGEAIP